MDKTMRKTMGKTYNMVYIAMCAVLMAVCSWISIPSVVPFTLQTFAVYLTLGLLGGRRGTMAILVYLTLGIVGIPVFSGFMGGPGILFGTTGGYLIGFVFSGLLVWGIEKILGRNIWVQAASMFCGLAACYVFGTAWFMLLYAQKSGPIGILTALGWCVFPFVIPDIIKILLALALSRKLSRALRR